MFRRLDEFTVPLSFAVSDPDLTPFVSGEEVAVVVAVVVAIGLDFNLTREWCPMVRAHIDVFGPVRNVQPTRGRDGEFPAARAILPHGSRLIGQEQTRDRVRDHVVISWVLGLRAVQDQIGALSPLGLSPSGERLPLAGHDGEPTRIQVRQLCLVTTGFKLLAKLMGSGVHAIEGVRLTCIPPSRPRLKPSDGIEPGNQNTRRRARSPTA